MKKYLFLVGVLFLATSAIKSQELSLEQILDKHYKASGLDKMQNVKTIVMLGTMVRNDVMPLKIYRVRPNKYRMERDVMDITGLTVYDGQTGWTTAPWTKNAKPQIATDFALNDLKNRADFDGALYDWKAKGHSIELIGTEKIGDTPVYRLKLTRNDAVVEFYLIDCNSFMLLKKIGNQKMRGKDYVAETIFSDYRNVEGIPFAFVTTTHIDSQFYSEMQFDTIEINKPVDENIFVMPEK